MKKQRQTFNFLLRKYYSYIRRKKNLMAANKNKRRQLILEKHIERLFFKLKSLKFNIQKATAVAAMTVGAFTFSVNEASAQNFGAAQTNPFGLVAPSSGYGYTNVTMADLDGDGDLDILSGEYYGNYYYYANTGTNLAPVFATEVINPFGLTNSGTYWSAPTFVDIDNDGDFDIMGHNYNYGDFLFYENTGTNLAPNFAAVQMNPFSLLQMGFNTISSPTFADLDNDGDLDILSCVDYNNSFLYYENTGSASTPVYAAALLNPFNITQVSGNNWVNVSLADVDGDGDFDLFLGDASGDIGYMKNIGDANTPLFEPEITNPFNLTNVGSYSNVSFADLDNDGDLDLMAGNEYGDFTYFELLNLPPASPTDVTPSTNLSICNNTSTTLSVTGVGTIGWYDAANGGAYLGGGNSYNTPVLTTNTIFYAQDSTIGGASSNRTAITVNVAAAIDVSTSINGLTISATASGASYQWLDCNNSNAIIASATNQDYTATMNGSYSVEITVAGCVDTSACVPVTTVGINETSSLDELKIYPNPSTGVFAIESNNTVGLVEVRVTTLEGKMIYSSEINNNRFNIDGSNWSKGIYLIQVKDEFNTRHMKLIIE